MKGNILYEFKADCIQSSKIFVLVPEGTTSQEYVVIIEFRKLQS